jgi:hypothetical protein
MFIQFAARRDHTWLFLLINLKMLIQGDRTGPLAAVLEFVASLLQTLNAFVDQLLSGFIPVSLDQEVELPALQS